MRYLLKVVDYLLLNRLFDQIFFMYKITKIEQKILKLGIINENIKGKINEKNAFLCFVFLFFIWF